MKRDGLPWRLFRVGRERNQVIRLVSHEFRVVGEGEHRSGWPYVLRCMEPMISADGILFDDFIEASFACRPVSSPHQEPWVGVFHQPP